MKRKIGLYFIAAAALAIYFLACSEKFMAAYVDFQTSGVVPQPLKWDRYEFGGLYGYCFLSEYKILRAGKYSVREKKVQEKKENDLWIIGDSFLRQMLQNDTNSRLFNTAVKDFYYFEQGDKFPRTIQLSKDRKNILLIEMTERFIRERFTVDAKVKKICTSYVLNQPADMSGYKPKILDKRIVPVTIEQNLETLLFGYEMYDGIKETKADFSAAIFKRVNQMVYVSDERKMLYLATTVDTLNIESSFKQISNKDVTAIVKKINEVSDHYKAMGFSDVVFSFIPSPSSVCIPEGFEYNKLIPRIQYNKNLNVHFINVYDQMMANPDPCSLFWKSDTHWNKNGYLLWENQFNEYLQSQ